MSVLIKAIETEYNGYKFRSRLEARWAVFFDALGVEYEYEPEGFELPSGKRYLPDFRVTCYGTRGNFTRHYLDDDGEQCFACAYGDSRDAFCYERDCKCPNALWDIDEDGYKLMVSGITFVDSGIIEHCPYFVKDKSQEPFDLYIEVKKGQRLSEFEADKIREFANIPKDGYGLSETPVLVVADIPNIEDEDDCYQSDLFKCYKDIGFGVSPFNYMFIDGDYFGAYPAVTKDGHFYLWGDDSNYITGNIDCCKKLMSAYRAARKARFEFGETPVICHE